MVVLKVSIHLWTSPFKTMLPTACLTFRAPYLLEGLATEHLMLVLEITMDMAILPPYLRTLPKEVRSL